MAQMMKSVSKHFADLTITVVSWNTADLLRTCLSSVMNQSTQYRVELHVVDNASSDHSVAIVETEFPEVRLIRNQINLGFARANNQSWKEARGRYWLLLNSDTEVQAGAIDELINFMDTHPQAALATARLNNPDGTPQYCALADPCIWRRLLQMSGLHLLLPAAWRGRILLGPYWSYDQTIKVSWTWGTALIARREAVEQVGPLSEDFFMYGEDLEWCLRMRKQGWGIWFCHQAEVVHLGARSSTQRWNNEEKWMMMADNYYQAIGMHFSPLYVWVLRLVMLLGLSGKQWIRQLNGGASLGTSAAIDYHKATLKHPWASRQTQTEHPRSQALSERQACEKHAQ